MASTDVIDWFKMWQLSSAANLLKQRLFIDQMLTAIRERESRLTKRFKKGPNSQTQTLRWYEQNSYENRITAQMTNATTGAITFSGNLLGAAISNASMRQHVHVGTILERVSDGQMVRLDGTFDYDAFTVTTSSEWGNSMSGTLTTDSAGVEYRILGQVSSDYDTTYVPKGLGRDPRTCSIQIWKSYFEIPWTRRDQAMQIVADEAAHQVREIVMDLNKKISMALIGILPYYSSGYKDATATETPAMTGVTAWPLICNSELALTNTYLDNSGVPVDVDVLNKLVYYNWLDNKADYNSGDWVVACHPVTHQYISDEFVDQRDFGMKETEVGYQVETFKSKIGKVFPIIADDYLRDDMLLLLNCKDIQWGFYGKQGIKVTQLAETEANADRKKITCSTYGTKVYKPRQIGVIYGLPTTYSFS